jgi:hypothetical protein
MLMFRQLIVLQQVKQILTNMGANILKQKAKRETRHQIVWVAIKMSTQWKKLLKRQGPDMETINNKKLQRVLTLVTLMKADRAEEKAKYILQDIMEQELSIMGMVQRVVSTSTKIRLIQ